MKYLTNEEIEKRKSAGVKMNKLDCGWKLPPAELAKIVTFINGWTPTTETEKRDKHILELAFIEDMNATQIARLNDPIIIGMGNRNHGKPLTPAYIWMICTRFAPAAVKHTKRTPAKKKRDALYRYRQTGGVDRPKICSTCGSKKEIELHHIIPLDAGGTNDYFNLIFLCHHCHMMLHHEIYDYLEIFHKGKQKE